MRPRHEAPLVPAPVVDLVPARSAAAVNGAAAVAERVKATADRANTRFHYKNSAIGKQAREYEAAEKKVAADQKKVLEYDILAAAKKAVDNLVTSLK